MLILVLFVFVLFVVPESCLVVSGRQVFTNSFLVEFHEDANNELANDVAKRNGFDNYGPVSIVNDIINRLSICFYHIE